MKSMIKNGFMYTKKNGLTQTNICFVARKHCICLKGTIFSVYYNIFYNGSLY